MISDSVLDYCKNIIATNRKEYPYYVLASNTNWDSYSYSEPVVYIYLAKDEIKSNGTYSYILPAGSRRLGVLSYNASNNNHGQRVINTAYAGALTVNEYEWVYTNVDTGTITAVPDLIDTFPATNTCFTAIGIIISILLVTNLVIRLVRS